MVQGHKFSTVMDPNSVLYLSKAADLFDIAHQQESYDAALEKIKCPVLVRYELLTKTFVDCAIYHCIYSSTNHFN